MSNVTQAPPLTLELPDDEALKYHVGQANGILAELRGIPSAPKFPAEIARKITLYTDLQYHVGELLAAAAHDAADLNADLKIGLIREKNKKTPGETIKDAEERAKIAMHALDKRVAKAKASLKRWEAMHDNCEQRANACKKELEVLQSNMRGNGYAGG